MIIKPKIGMLVDIDGKVREVIEVRKHFIKVKGLPGTVNHSEWLFVYQRDMEECMDQWVSDNE